MKSLQVIFTRDSTKVLKASLFLQWTHFLNHTNQILAWLWPTPKITDWFFPNLEARHKQVCPNMIKDLLLSHLFPGLNLDRKNLSNKVLRGIVGIFLRYILHIFPLELKTMITLQKTWQKLTKINPFQCFYSFLCLFSGNGYIYSHEVFSIIQEQFCISSITSPCL